MYESFYHLKEQPFGTTPDPKYLYKSDGHREALAYLAYGIFQKKGFLALTGEVGIGKTTVIRAFVHAFHPSLEVGFVLNTNVDFEEMLYLILEDFGCEVPQGSKVKMLTALNDYLIERFAANRNPVIVIDEAQNLSSDVLEELRMLSNLETNEQKLIQIVLVGQQGGTGERSPAVHAGRRGNDFPLLAGYSTSHQHDLRKGTLARLFAPHNCYRARHRRSERP
jgi:general secretion pathway protein A